MNHMRLVRRDRFAPSFRTLNQSNRRLEADVDDGGIRDARDPLEFPSILSNMSALKRSKFKLTRVSHLLSLLISDKKRPGEPGYFHRDFFPTELAKAGQ